MEEELVDDYARGELEGDEKESFERDYLVSAERRAKLEFAAALRAHVAQKQPKPSLVWDWLRGPVATPGWALAVAAALLLAVSGTIWQFATGRGPGGEVYARLSSGPSGTSAENWYECGSPQVASWRASSSSRVPGSTAATWPRRTR